MIQNAQVWKTPLLVGLVDIAIGLMALALHFCVSPAAVAVTLGLSMLGIGLVWRNQPVSARIVSWSALGSLLVTGYSFFMGCTTEWRELRGEIVPYYVVSDMVSNPWVGASLALLGALLCGLLFVFVQGLLRRAG
jgi:hypothetical protein